MSKKKAEFPKVIRVGQTRATIYKTPSNGCDSYTVVWYEGAARKRKAFADPGLAAIHASSQVNNLSKGETRAAKLSGEECLEYVRAKNAVQGYALTLDTAAAEYREAKEILKGGSLVEAARYYASKRLLNIPQKPVDEVLRELLQAKRNEGCSARYVRDLKSRLGRFSREFPRMIMAVSGLEIKNWLQGLTREGSRANGGASKQPVSNRTRNNFRLCIQTFFLFAKSQRYLPLDWNDLEGIPVWKMKNDVIEIFTPEEMGFVLAYAPTDLVPFVAIGGFAGLRSAEIERLDWSKVDLEGGYITVDAGIAKTNSRRLVPIVPNLKAWLTDHKRPRGPVLDMGNRVNPVRRIMRAVRLAEGGERNTKSGEGMAASEGSSVVSEQSTAVGFTWRHNALRHSFCSYRLADVKSAAQVALEAGNSPQMIFQHYRELVTEKGAKAWFAITPESTKALREQAEKERQAKIVAFPAKAAA